MEYFLVIKRNDICRNKDESQLVVYEISNLSIFSSDPSSKSVVVSYCGFHFYFPHDLCLASFNLPIHMSFSVNACSNILPIFISLFLGCKNSFYFPYSSSLSDVFCRYFLLMCELSFILLRGSFEKQKF